jgi:hypothetical protein
MEKHILRNLNELEGKGQFHFEVSDRFAAVEDLDT